MPDYRSELRMWRLTAKKQLTIKNEVVCPHALRMGVCTRGWPIADDCGCQEGHLT
jgi:hypothetical protein